MEHEVEAKQPVTTYKWWSQEPEGLIQIEVRIRKSGSESDDEFLARKVTFLDRMKKDHSPVKPPEMVR